MYGDDRKGPKRRQTHRLGSTTAALGHIANPIPFNCLQCPSPVPKKHAGDLTRVSILVCMSYLHWAQTLQVIFCFLNLSNLAN